jgi:hypothetical protein
MSHSAHVLWPSSLMKLKKNASPVILLAEHVLTAMPAALLTQA